MRRSDREITDFEEMLDIMRECDVCRLALNGDGYPYILPLNFGMRVDGGRVELFFHGAAEGTKFDLIGRDNRAAFEMDCGHQLVDNLRSESCAMNYRSVIGYGRIEPVLDGEKYDALCLLMTHYHKEEFPISRAMMPHTRVFKLVVEHMSGKRRESPV